MWPWKKGGQRAQDSILFTLLNPSWTAAQGESGKETVKIYTNVMRKLSAVSLTKTSIFNSIEYDLCVILKHSHKILAIV